MIRSLRLIALVVCTGAALTCTVAAAAASSHKSTDRPLITAITPHKGDAMGGGHVLVSGRNLTDIKRVTVGGKKSSFQPWPTDEFDSTQVAVLLPALKPGLHQVVITTDAGTSKRTGHSTYRYIASPWNQQRPALPGSGAGTVDLSNPACSASACYAGGSKGTSVDAADLVPLIDTQPVSGGPWRKASIKPPPDTGRFNDAVVYGIGCSGRDSCIGVGADHVRHPHTARPLLFAGSGRSWRSAHPPMPADFDNHRLWSFTTMACHGTSCVAAGWYVNDQSEKGLLVETYAHGRWTLRSPSDQVEEFMEVFFEQDESAVATCPSASMCLVFTRIAIGQPIVVHVPMKSSDAVTVEQLPWQPAGDDNAITFSGAACSTATACVVSADQYVAPTTSPKPDTDRSSFYATYTDGVWQQHEWPLPSGLDPSDTMAVRAGEVACSSNDACYAVGFVYDTTPADAPPQGWTAELATVTRITPDGARTTLPPMPDRYFGASALSGVFCRSGGCVAFGNSRPADDDIPSVRTEFSLRLGTHEAPRDLTLPSKPHQTGGSWDHAPSCATPTHCIVAGTNHVGKSVDGNWVEYGRSYLLHN